MWILGLNDTLKSIDLSILAAKEELDPFQKGGVYFEKIHCLVFYSRLVAILAFRIPF